MRVNNTFLNDVDLGLSSMPKFLNSRYFYDSLGDKLFQQIMKMPEYYLTRAEFEIFTTRSQEIINALDIKNVNNFELIELGAGDGTKTSELIKTFLSKHYRFTYSPIDISKHVLIELKQRMLEQFPQLKVNALQGDYFNVLESLKTSNHPKVILFLGSNLGNLKDENAKIFLKKLSSVLNPGDKILLGLDLIKSENIVLPAYSDSQGITAEFNLNLLKRINKEFNADFNIKQFYHHAEYKESEGIAKSFIISKVKQEVCIQALNKCFTFEENERIHTEISRKYNDEILNEILNEIPLRIDAKIIDSKAYFADYILKRS